MKNFQKHREHRLAEARESLNELFNEISGTLDFFAGMGCKGVDCSKQSLSMVQGWGRDDAVSDPPLPLESSGLQSPHHPPMNLSPPGASGPDAPLYPDHLAYPEVSSYSEVFPSSAISPVFSIDASLKEIEADIENCRRCARGQTRQKIVFGSGPLGAPLMFAGDWPDSCDDQTETVASPAGLLLFKMIEATGLDRTKVQMCGLVKCRVPGVRRASPDEIRACLPFLKRHIRLASPDIICAMGASATSAFLGDDRPFSSLRGRFYSLKIKTGDRDGRAPKKIKVMPTHHPAWLMEHPEDKREAWEDIKKIMKERHR